MEFKTDDFKNMEFNGIQETAPMEFKTDDFKNMILDSGKNWVKIVDPDFDDGSGIC